MNTGFFSLEQMAAIYEVEQDWLFEKFLGKLNAHEHLILSADQGWGLQEYVRELGFQLTENNPDIHTGTPFCNPFPQIPGGDIPHEDRQQ